MTDTSHHKGIAWAVGATVLLAVAMVSSRYLMTAGVNPYFAGLIRALVGALFALGAGMAANRQSVRWGLPAVGIGIGRAGGTLLFFPALAYISATEFSIVQKTIPLFVFGFGVLFFRRFPNWRTVALIATGSALVMAGAAIALDYRAGGVDHERLVGTVLTLGTCFFSALFSASMSVPERFSESWGMAERQYYFGIINLVAAIPLIVIVFYFHVKGVSLIDGAFSFGLLVLAGLLNGVFGLVYFEAVKTIGAERSAIITALDVFVVLLLEALLGLIEAQWHHLAGGAVAVLGTILYVRALGQGASRRAAKTDAPGKAVSEAA